MTSPHNIFHQMIRRTPDASTKNHLYNSKSLRLIILTGIGMIAGLSLDVYLAYLFGTSLVNDALFIGLSLPIFFDVILREGVRLGLVPLLKSSKDIENKSLNFLLSWFFLVGFILFITTNQFASQIIGLLGEGLSSQGQASATLILKILSFSLIITPANSLLGANLNANGRFYIPGLRNLVIPTIAILTMLIGKVVNVELVAIGFLFGFFIYFLLSLTANIKAGLKLRFILFIPSSLKSEISKSLFFPFIGISSRNLTRIFERSIAATIIAGGVSSFYFAFRIYSAIQGIIGMSMATIGIVVFIEDKNNLLNRVFKQSFKVVVLVTPIALILFYFSNEIMQLVYFRGNVNEESMKITVSSLKGLSFGLIFFTLSPTISAALYSLGKHKQVMINSIMVGVLGLILAWKFGQIWGIPGLAYAVSTTSLFGFLNLSLFLNQAIRRLN